MTDQETITQVGYASHLECWKATETTADCQRWIAHRGQYNSLADALYALRDSKPMLSIQAYRVDIDAAREQVREWLKPHTKATQ